MGDRTLFILIVLGIFAGVITAFLNTFTPIAQAPVETPEPEQVFCTADAMQCPDGSYVGRTGDKCEFVCPPVPAVPVDVQDHIDSKADIIKVNLPLPLSVVTSPLSLTGEARGNWYFEASAPVSLVNWDGLIIAEGIVTADGEWMTTEFVPFKGELTFESPYKEGDPDFMKRGAIIFKKDNPSGLPENDDALEFPVWFEK